MARHTETLQQLLAQGPITARQAVEKTGLSQPTVSRALAGLGDALLRIGAGPSIRYALHDRYRGVGAAPVFRVTEQGQVQTLGELVPVLPGGFVMQEAEGQTQHSEGLPWWLFDMRPQGYLGRAYAARYAGEFGLPANPESWHDTDVLRLLLAHGHDSIGNLLIGPLARERFLHMPQPEPADRAHDYPALAQAAGAGEAAGSSAGGEQPKFCAYTERGHVLVKFSLPDDNALTERWRDLLLAEHLALAVLGVDTALFDFGTQRFLEVPRFDRIGTLGRLGVFSLRALDMEFVGAGAAPWPATVARLAAAGHVDAQATADAALLWAFGTLIGNTDMHAGNLSFIVRQGRPYQLAPAYDVLPMGFAPRSSGALVNTLPPATLTPSVDGALWREALALAEQFHAKLAASEGFSAAFSPCITALRQHLDEAAVRIARLG